MKVIIAKYDNVCNSKIQNLTEKQLFYSRLQRFSLLKVFKFRIKSFCRVDCEVYDYIVKKETEGKCKKSAKIAGLNKFLRQYLNLNTFK